MNKNALRALIGTALSNGGRALSAPEAQWLCDAYGIPTPKQGFAKTATEAVKIATRLRFPVALKIVSSDILHKTEAGGVLLDLQPLAKCAALSIAWSRTPRDIGRTLKFKACRCSRW